MNKAISCQNLILSYANQLVLNSVNLNIYSGEFIAVLGSNGAGKTSLMRALLGLLPPKQGSIKIFGQTPKEARKSIAYLPQTRTISHNCNITGHDFVSASINGHLLGTPFFQFRHTKKKNENAISQAMEIVRAQHLSERPIKTLSGGERQRLLLAQCLLGSPRILLLDEPLSNLDPAQQQNIVNLISQISHSHNLTVLFCAHELNSLISSVDRILYLGKGKAAIGKPEEVMTKPVLSQLYDTDIDILYTDGRYFVMSGAQSMENDRCCTPVISLTKPPLKHKL